MGLPGFIARQPLWPIEEFTLLLFPLYWLLATVIPAKLMLGWDAELAVLPKFLIGLLLPLAFLAFLFLPDFFTRHRTGSLWIIGIGCGVAIVGLILAIKIGARRMA